MAEPEGAELEAIREHRGRLRSTYLRPSAERPASSVRGVHHLALVCRDVEETIGAVQHLALSVDSEQFAAAKARFDEAGVEYLGPDRGADDSLYIRDPNGVGLELYREDLGVFEGTPLLAD
jgi:glyoxylase I family protein